MTSPPCENVSFSGFTKIKNKKAKCFHQQLQPSAAEQSRTHVARSFLISGSQISGQNTKNAKVLIFCNL